MRTAERLAPDFEARLLTSLRREPAGASDVSLRVPLRVRGGGAGAARDGRGGWWRRPRELRVSPLAGLAIAAGFAGVVSLATLAAAGRSPRTNATSTATAVVTTPALPPAAETVHVVRFVLAEPRAARVTLVGDFNGWAADATPLAAEPGRDGVWTVSVPLRPGRHEYAFVVDGTRWVTDPLARPERDEYATESSIVTVGAPAERGT